tara:strand:- start:2289 stop:2585 length:297 start_codon:yes stop_codon:yes gene_type:complete
MFNIESKSEINNKSIQHDIYSNIDSASVQSIPVLDITVLTSTPEELALINNFIVNATGSSVICIGGIDMVLFYKDAKDTIVSREVSSGSDETYKLFVQ